MQPNHSDLYGSGRHRGRERHSQLPLDSATTLHSASNVQRLRHEDSWIEISSQPSSSSLSSVGDHEIITTGLQIGPGPDATPPRHRRIRHALSMRRPTHARPRSTGGSSQDEYDESESESDRILSSSNEEIDLTKQDSAPSVTAGARANNEDENPTAFALPAADDAIFTPQPNVFSHPPSSQISQAAGTMASATTSYFPNIQATSPRDGNTNETFRCQTQSSRQSSSPSQFTAAATLSAPRNFPASSHVYQPDHDAALRASLSTLLSCAAAVRSSPKPSHPSRELIRPRQVTGSSQPTSFRLIPESQMNAENTQTAPRLPPFDRDCRQQSPPLWNTGSPPLKPVAQPKRKVREHSKDRHAKKSKNVVRSSFPGDETTLSPTLMSWMISAGLVLVFSAISFSAGYAWGKEAGRIEGAAGVAVDGATCGQEALRSGAELRRLRWSGANSSALA